MQFQDFKPVILNCPVKQRPKSVSKPIQKEEDEKVKYVGTEIGEKIKKARCEKGWTQNELAQRLNLKPNIVSEFESGRAVINNRIMASFKRVLNY